MSPRSLKRDLLNRTGFLGDLISWSRRTGAGCCHISLGDLTPAEFKKHMGTTHGWLGESPTGVILQ